MFQLQSKCAHCQNVRFELSEEAPENSAFKVYFVRCAGCKNPIGILPYQDTNTKIDSLEEKLDAVNKQTNQNLAIINQNIEKLSRK
jgi:hypothetical protein